MSMISPSSTCPCLVRSASSLSRTMSFTLLSDSLITRLMKQDAAASNNLERGNRYIQRRTFDSCRVLGQCGEGSGSFVFHSV